MASGERVSPHALGAGAEGPGGQHPAHSRVGTGVGTGRLAAPLDAPQLVAAAVQVAATLPPIPAPVGRRHRRVRGGYGLQGGYAAGEVSGD